jgi:tRNA pseudouridine55 synthase
MVMKNKGIIPINKPQNWTSFDVVNKLKYKLKPLKVGHLGTLDPMATGVLLVTVGKATKLFDLMQEKQKTYVATFEFGYETDTLDATGEIQKQTSKIPTLDEIKSILSKFVGQISQIPPKYSAKSIDGVRAYDLARQNIDFELKAKQVEIHSIEVISFVDSKLKLNITCGSGTYIRSIGRDIAYELNTFATMTELIRTKVGRFDLSKCHDIQNIINPEDHIVSIKEILDYETMQLALEEKQKLLNGQTIEVNKNDGLFLLEDETDVVALIKISDNKAKMSLFLGD